MDHTDKNGEKKLQAEKPKKSNPATRLKITIIKTVKKEEKRKKHESYRRRCSVVIYPIPKRVLDY